LQHTAQNASAVTPLILVACLGPLAALKLKNIL